MRLLVLRLIAWLLRVPAQTALTTRVEPAVSTSLDLAEHQRLVARIAGRKRRYPVVRMDRWRNE